MTTFWRTTGISLPRMPRRAGRRWPYPLRCRTNRRAPSSTIFSPQASPRLDARARVDHLHGLADLQQVERVRVVVDVGDRLSGDLDDDVVLYENSVEAGSEFVQKIV